MSKKPELLIIGLGLLGASLAKALRRSGKYRISAWARGEKSRRWAVENQAADEVFFRLDEALAQADIAVLCVPVPAAIALLPECEQHLKPGAVLTDIGSVKQEIVSAAQKFPQLRFVGSHPMAGTEKSGCENSFPELYANADVFVTLAGDGEAENICAQMWLDAGCARVEKIGAAEHDELVADTSHVLHLLASAMTLSILDGQSAAEQRQHFAGCATGFRDTTRIASSHPRMWREIMESNTPAVLRALERFEVRFTQLQESLQQGDFDRFEQLFARGKLLRSAWLGYKKPRPARVALCGIKHCGKSSVGKELSVLLPAQFVDSDELIAAEYARRTGEKLSVREIYRTLGEENFRKLENDCLVLIANMPGAIVAALGGGAVSNPFVSPETLAKIGTVVWLDVADEVAWQRVKAAGLPPFLANEADPYAAFVSGNAKRRELFAGCAGLSVTAKPEDTPRDAALKIVAMLG